MTVEIRPLAESDLPKAAAILAAMQKRRRAREPVLPIAYEAAEEALKPLSESFASPGACGFAGFRDGSMAAYLLGIARMPGRVMVVPFHGQGLQVDEPLETVRELYALLADDWVRRGFFTHSVSVLDGERDLRECWDSLGFGRWLTTAVRDVQEPVASAPELDIRELGADHLDVIAQLEAANARHHSLSPVFNPYLFEDRQGYRDRTEALLQEPGNAHFVAYEDGEPAGMNTFMTKSWHSPVLEPEKDIYLFQGIVYEHYRHAGIGRALLAHSMRWARSQGYSTCTLHYFPMNLLGARFWTSQGFRPLAHMVNRHIDERIAWARPG